MKKALIITTVSGFVPQFEMNNVKILQELGYEIHYASNFTMPVYGEGNKRLKGTGIICHQIDFVRSPFQLWKNRKAFLQLKELMKKEHFYFVHCHTPMGGVIGRLAAKKNKINKIFYTAHGFHFYRGAPIWNWVFFYPVEWYLAKYTDVLITINKEDFQLAKRFFCNRNKKCKVEKINGIGIALEKYQDSFIHRKEKRKELGIEEEDFLFISVGELTKRKNHKIIINIIANMEEKAKYIICGTGRKKAEIEKLIKKKKIENRVFLLGYREDIKEILNAGDCFIFPSLQEGLPVALMEAVAMGLPCICSKIRGNIDLEKAGDIIYVNKKQEKKRYQEQMEKIMKIKKERNKNIRMKPYSSKEVIKTMRKIYSQNL